MFKLYSPGVTHRAVQFKRSTVTESLSQTTMKMAWSYDDVVIHKRVHIKPPLSVVTPTWPVFGRVVEEAEAQQQQDCRPPGEFAQELHATHAFPPHGPKGQHHRRADDEHKPGGKHQHLHLH